MKNSIFIFTFLLLFFGISQYAFASIYPVGSVDVLLKNTENGRVTIFKAEKNGMFHATGLEGNSYDVYFYDESQNPLATKVAPKNGTITGRLLFQLKDDSKADSKKILPKSLNTFTMSTIGGSKLADLKQLFQTEGLLPPILEPKDQIATLKDLKDVIKKFQAHFSLTQTGTITKGTLSKLNDIADENALWAQEKTQ